MQQLLRKIGFEVEFTCPVNPLPLMDGYLRDIGQPVVNYGSYRHSDGIHWDLKRDSSCGYEIASPIVDTYTGLLNAAKIVNIVKRFGGTVNEKCGLHVHVDLNHITAEDFQRIMRFMSRYEDSFFLLADKWRQNNQYCRKLNGQAEAVKNDPSGYRQAWNYKHFWLNGTHLRGQGTLEFRLMASHLEAEYIVGWTLFLVHTIDYLLKGKTVSWGQAKCASDRDLLQTMLGQAGFYGPFDNRDKPTIVAARKWALGTYTAKVGQDDRRIKVPTMEQLASISETPVDSSTSMDRGLSTVTSPTPRRRAARVRRSATTGRQWATIDPLLGS